MQRDSVSFTFTVAAVLCVVCSLLVSSAAEALKPIQERNKVLDKNKNVLLAAGLLPAGADAAQVKAIFSERIRPEVVDLDTGRVAPESEVPKNYDPRKAAKNPSLQQAVEPPDALKGIRFREPYASVYKILAEGSDSEVEGYILPVYGKGLWSTLYGFLALEADRKTVRGITFYEHAETPGLGGEVDNAQWKATWKGKVAIEDDMVVLHVAKGSVPADSPAASHTIDGLSGATLTTKGVDSMVQYWLGPQGFGPYLANAGDGAAAPAKAENETDEEHAVTAPQANPMRVNNG